MPEIAKDIYRSLKAHFNVFYDEQMTGAILDRVLHHCHLLLFPGQSQRMRESGLMQ